MKMCKGCDQELTDSCFTKNKNLKRGLSRLCKPCNSAYMKSWYAANIEAQRPIANKNNAQWKAKKKAEVLGFVHQLKTAPCTDCKNSFYPWVMQYDHRNPVEKKYNVANMVNRRMPIAAILEEIAKCDLVCANCHADRTYRSNHKDS